MTPPPADRVSRILRHENAGQELLSLSQGQLSFWTAQMLDRNDPAFNIGECVEILGAIDPSRFEWALRRAVEISDALHLRFLETENGPRQYVSHDPSWTLPRVDFQSETDPGEAARAWMDQDMARAFDLDDGPLYRFALLQIAPERFFWYAVNHHLINDGVGWRLFLARVADIYTQGPDGEAWPSAGSSFTELLDEEHAYRNSVHFQRDRDFWKTHLTAPPPRITLSGKPPRRPAGYVKSIGWLPRSLDLNTTGQRHGANAAAMLVAATAIYLHRMTGAGEMMLAMPVGARIGAKMRAIIGMAANAVPLRMSIAPSDRIGDVVRQAAREARTALRHQRYRLEDMRRDLGLGPRDGEIAGTLVNFTSLDEDIKFADASILRNPLGNWWVEDLQIVFYGGDNPAGLRVDFIANARHYNAEDLSAHCARFVELMTELAAAPSELEIAALATPAVPPAPNRNEQAQLAAPSEHATALPPAPPETATELALAGIWRDILRVQDIARNDDFFDIGGDSLLANILTTRARKLFQIDLPLNVVFKTPTLAALASHIETAANEKRLSDTTPPLSRIDIVGPAPLSFSQHRMWLIHSLDQNNSAYNMSGATRLVGELDVAALSQAIDALRKRHEIMRTTYGVVDGTITQRVHEWTEHPLEVVDLTQDFDGPEAEAEAERRANIIAAAPINLATGPIFHCVLMRTGPDKHVLQTTIHHIAGDQWSFGLLGRELAAVYNSIRRGQPLELPASQIRYRDFARWQQTWLEGPELSAQIDYWRNALRDVPTLNLPTDRPRPRLQSLKGSYCVAPISSGLIEKLEHLGRRKSTTLFMTMFAGFAALLHRLSGQNDFAIGVPVANRTHAAVENVVGTFVNTLALRVDLSPNPTFDDLLDNVRAVALNAFANQDVPFDKLVQDLLRTRDTSRPPLVQVMFNMLNAPMHGIDLDGITWQPILIDRGGAQFEISLSVDCQVTNTVTVEYNSDLYDRTSVERFIARYIQILESAVAAPDLRIGALDILPPEERRLLLETWNSKTASASPQPFITMFETRAATHPGKSAVSFAGRILSYGQLNAQANVLAHALRDAGAARGVLIGICLDRSLDMLTALLAIQKSGAAYVPLDPKLPPKRLDYMIADSNLDVLIATPETAARLTLREDIKIIDATDLLNNGTSQDAPDIEYPISMSDPAYVIYTSGSTGKPKAVAISHGALANLLSSMQNEPGLAADDVLAAVTTMSFDIAALELYLPLLTGARIELVSSETASDAYALSAQIAKSGATVMQATPATWRMLLDAGWHGGAHFRAFCGGEALSRELADALLARVGALWNFYGPTETTIWSTIARVPAGEAPISIGKPIANTCVYILNGDTPAPIGAAGEICIGGDGVAIGYLGRPELNAERFRSNPFDSTEGARLYRTGDLGRWGEDGNLYHMGRLDHQVKIRGFRIELGEIETFLRTHPAVRESVVVSKDLGASDTRLVAYVVYADGPAPTASDIRRYLRQYLPDYMIPSMIVALDRLPLTPNGKVDRNAFPDPFAGVSDLPAHAPESVREKLIADIWRELLKIDRVTADDNFFDLGGHSLLALRAVAQIEKQTGLQLDPRTLFFQNLRQIAANLPDVEVSLR